MEKPEETVKRNKNIDVGALLVEDCECYDNLGAEEIKART